jgi:phosphoribosylaminoimidazolecarboxamide formyltransferase/IMP cyclohydrolase
MTARRALLSVSDKTGIAALARRLAALGWELLSTGGTARALREAGLAVTEVADYTGAPEILDGRVKTLHPRVHAGLLARRDLDAHRVQMQAAGHGWIDLLAVNLYPFRETVARPGCTLEEALDNIDIGGPALIRSAAKNHAGVIVLTDPADYDAVAAELESGGVDAARRYALAAKAYAHTAAYDAAISNWLAMRDGTAGAAPASAWPRRLHLQFDKVQELRYGENPHQRAAFYRDPEPAPGTLACHRQLQGKELSYNNLADADAAWECVTTFDAPACVIVKHANPCGVALGADCASAWRGAYATDPTSAFGGIVAFNRTLDAACVDALDGLFIEVLLAPAYSAGARARLAARANLRVLEVALARDAARPGAAQWDCQRIGGGLLVQDPDHRRVARAELRVASRREPAPDEWDDLLFAWRVAKYVKSNAIVFAAGGRTLGIGAGQMSRIDSARIAALKAGQTGLALAGSVVASDAFFPFRDGLDVVVQSGARAVIQPGGSLRDDEVIAAADEQGIALVLTGVRHFRH